MVPANTWMGALTRGEWSLVGTTMAPPYHHDGFELGNADELIEQYPSAAAEIAGLVCGREPPRLRSCWTSPGKVVVVTGAGGGIGAGS